MLGQRRHVESGVPVRMSRRTWAASWTASGVPDPRVGPMVLPTAFGVDLDGPDEGGTLYLHGSVASRSLRAAPDLDVCVTLTVLDGLVLARSAFHHSRLAPNRPATCSTGLPGPAGLEEGRLGHEPSS